ncbi:protein CREG1-like [Ctenocephalides felis]|uniref:protein CREG1-like n=1 Tax=Ctenocephalides felis TaxID=7515 RepID=UPI000E6E31BC|nr:protein CREG1-like [Ctenocephalides felis]
MWNLTSILILVLVFAWSTDAVKNPRGIKTPGRFASHSKSARYGSPDPEVNRRLAGIARQMLRQYHWGAFGVLSDYWETYDYPFVTPKMFAEGNSTYSSGMPYFFLSPDYYVTQHLEHSHKVSFSVSRMQSGECKEDGIDVQNPRCFFVVFNGNFTKLERGTPEYEEGYQFLTEKYPRIETTPNKENYVIGYISLIDVMIVAGKEELECIPMGAYHNTPPNENYEEEEFGSTSSKTLTNKKTNRKINRKRNAHV